MLLYSCDSTNNKTASNIADTVKTDTSTVKPTVDTARTDTSSASVEKPSETSWVYSEKEDKMTSGKKYYASVDAKDLLEFDFPYDGGSTATLTIRKSDGENNALLSVSKGQFNSSIDGTTVRIRFDKEQAITFSASSASDGSTEVIFINNVKKLVRKLKQAKKIIIQAEFYNAGFKEMEFDVAGFKWDH